MGQLSSTTIVFCTEPHCRLPVGRIVNSALVIVSKHHGEKHSVSIPLADILRLISEQSEINPLTNVAEVCCTPAVKS